MTNLSQYPLTPPPEAARLKEAALKELAWVDKNLKANFFRHCDAIHTIRRALEALPDD